MRPLLCAALLAAMLPALARAGLGRPEDSIESDRAQARATARTWDTVAYRVHELTIPSGDRVREYVGTDGLVFAVAWDGPFMPNLRALLGSQFEVLRAAGIAPGDHSQLHLQQPDVVFHSIGHLRAFRGQAYLPRRVPAGVDARDLR